MRLEMSPGLELKQSLTLSYYQKTTLNKFLEMTNEELFACLKNYEGKGTTGAHPMFSIEKVMTVPRHLDVWVKNGFIHESSSNYIRYSSSNEKGRGSRKLISFIAWVLKMREKMLKVATGFILSYQKDFLFYNKSLHPMSMQDAVNHINNHMEDYFLDYPIGHSNFTRIIKNKMISVEGREFPMRFFFTSCILHPHDLKKWFEEVTKNEKKPLSDRELVHKCYERFGVHPARRTIAKYRNEFKIPTYNKRAP